jgi:protein-disulfide isomerase
MNAAAQDIGVPSANPADNPPQVDPDLATRSTDPDRPPAYGPEDAEVLIMVFSDYQCPSCRRINQATHQIAAEFPGEVRLELWHHPLPSHKAAEIAAVAAVAAQRQGRFWEMHDRIFANKERLDEARLEALAQELGLDMDGYRADVKDPAVLERVRSEAELAVALGAINTPGFVINGKVKQGWASWPNFRSIVGKEVAAANALAEQGMDPSEIRNQRAIENNDNSETYEAYRSAVLEPRAPVAPE